MIDERQCEIARDIISMVKSLEPDYLQALACTIADVACDMSGKKRREWAAEYIIKGAIMDELELEEE